MNQTLTRFFSGLAREYVLASKVVIAVALTLIATFFYTQDIFERLENLSLDHRFKSRAIQPVSPKIVLVEIAEDSIDAVGRWPWDRKWHASLVKALQDFGARAVAFDMLFSEPSTLESDNLFQNSIASAGNVYLSTAADGNTVDSKIIRSTPELQAVMKKEGHISIGPDSDGVLRRIPVTLPVPGSEKIYQLGMVMAMDHLNVDPAKTVRTPFGMVFQTQSGARISVPLDKKGNYLINWTGKWSESFTHVSYVDTVLSYTQWLQKETPRIAPETFKDAFVIVGVSAMGLFDIRATPLEPAYPAMGVNATVLSNMIDGKFLTPMSDLAAIALMWLLSVIILFIMWKSNYTRAMLLILLLAVVYLAIAYGVFGFARIVLPVTYPLFLIFSSYLAMSIYHQIVISIEKKRLLKLATMDQLTGLFNIGHFKRLLSAELLSTQLRSQKDLTLLMIDGDYFKIVNDTYGHATGDEVLRGISASIRNHCRALDIAARYGGEEFILMLPGANTVVATKVAEKIRIAVSEVSFAGQGTNKFNVTVSIGVTAHIPGEGMEDFMKRADQALYLAKKSGRNCVCVM